VSEIGQRLRSLLPQARQQAPAHGGSVGAALAHLSGLAPAVLAAHIQDAFGMPWIGHEAAGSGVAAVDFCALPSSECLARGILPVRMNDEVVFAVADPWDDLRVQWIANRIGRLPTLAVADPALIRARVEDAQARMSASAGKPAAAGGQTRRTDPADRVVSIESIERADNPVVRFVDSVVYDGWRSGASDLHFECSREGLQVKFRLDGVLVPAAAMPEPERAEQAISRIKVLAQLDITERRVPQDGRFRLRLGEREVDFRVSIMPSVFGEDAVIRLLDKTQLRSGDAGLSLEALGFDADILVQMRRLARRPHGMLLVTGPTGSGKTTSLYAVLSEIHDGREKIVTIEDPVEYELPGVLQIPVNEKKGLTFAKGLRSILRHDPDKILVGEIRDAETAEIAVQAALTGHLVFTTVHANNVYDVVGRFLHMNVDLYSFMSALNGVVAQRLVRLNCQRCSEEAAGGEAELALLARYLGDATPLRLRRGRGCEHCRQTGYKGRMAIAEILAIDDRLRGLVVKRVPIEEIKAHAAGRGARSIEQCALALVAEGRTTFEEVERVVAFD
jgi:general secretion pathway protein E